MPARITIVRKPNPIVGVFRCDHQEGIGDPAFYLFRKIPVEFGRAGYEVVRLGDPVPHHVLIVGPTTSHCDCVGCCHHGMCRHLEAIMWIHAGWVVNVPPGTPDYDVRE